MLQRWSNRAYLKSKNSRLSWTLCKKSLGFSLYISLTCGRLSTSYIDGYAVLFILIPETQIVYKFFDAIKTARGASVKVSRFDVKIRFIPFRTSLLSIKQLMFPVDALLYFWDRVLVSGGPFMQRIQCHHPETQLTHTQASRTNKKCMFDNDKATYHIRTLRVHFFVNFCVLLQKVKNVGFDEW